jgi:hypothetical protein
VVVDASYFGKRREATELDGIMVFVDAITGEVLWAKFIKNETNSDYQEGLDFLESRGFEILGVVSDGRKGLAGIFKNYPYQVCQFHIQKGISTILTRNPKSIAGRDLKRLMTPLSSSDSPKISSPSKWKSTSKPTKVTSTKCLKPNQRDTNTRNSEKPSTNTETTSNTCSPIKLKPKLTHSHKTNCNQHKYPILPIILMEEYSHLSKSYSITTQERQNKEEEFG